MPSVTYMNQSAPFWDFIAGLEQQGQNHPFFARNQNDSNERGDEGHPFGPWGWGFPPQDLPHRGPPPPPGPPPHEHHAREGHNEEEGDKDNNHDNDNDNGERPSGSGSDSEGYSSRHGHRGRHGRCDRRRGHSHGSGPRGHHHAQGPHGFHGRGGFGPRHGPPRHWGGRGGWGPWTGRGGPFGGHPWNPLNFAAGFFDPSANQNNNSDEAQDFTPEADVFDTASSFTIHVSLPGAKKEDAGVNWDAEKSELSIAGVIYRPNVDEDMLKTLATGERKTGPFERKIRLGTRANPAQIDAEGITAKLEDGVLRVEVPKLEMEFVEVRKVDIE